MRQHVGVFQAADCCCCGNQMLGYLSATPPSLSLNHFPECLEGYYPVDILIGLCTYREEPKKKPHTENASKIQECSDWGILPKNKNKKAVVSKSPLEGWLSRSGHSS